MSSILVLDDRAIERELLVTVLGYAGHAVVEASTGTQALEAVNLEQIKLGEQLRQAERQTAESLTRLQTLQSSAPVGFGFVDRDFRVVQMNETLAAVQGLALDQQVGRTVAEIAPELWPAVEPIYRQVLETGGPIVNVELHRAYPSDPDDVRHLLASDYPVWLADEVIGIGVVVIDVTELRQADDFRSVVTQNIAEGLYVTDAQDRLVFMNPAASSMTGWLEADMRGKPVHAAIHHQHADGSPFAEQDCELSKVLSDGRSVKITDDAFVRRDGTIFPVAGSAAPPLSGTTTVRGSVVVFRDTTEEHAEEVRVQHELDELSWVGRLRDALDDERLVLFSQPIIPVTAGASPSQELLVRMVGRGGEIIAPGRFLPVAEKYGQIREVDQWVLTQAARLAAAGTHLHANLSAASVGNRELLQRVEQVFHEAGADPANLVARDHRDRADGGLGRRRGRWYMLRTYARFLIPGAVCVAFLANLTPSGIARITGQASGHASVTVGRVGGHVHRAWPRRGRAPRRPLTRWIARQVGPPGHGRAGDGWAST